MCLSPSRSVAVRPGQVRSSSCFASPPRLIGASPAGKTYALMRQEAWERGVVRLALVLHQAAAGSCDDCVRVGAEQVDWPRAPLQRRGGGAEPDDEVERVDQLLRGGAEELADHRWDAAILAELEARVPPAVIALVPVCEKASTTAQRIHESRVVRVLHPVGGFEHIQPAELCLDRKKRTFVFFGCSSGLRRLPMCSMSTHVSSVSPV